MVEGAGALAPPHLPHEVIDMVGRGAATPHHVDQEIAHDRDLPWWGIEGMPRSRLFIVRRPRPGGAARSAAPSRSDTAPAPARRRTPPPRAGRPDAADRPAPRGSADSRPTAR